MGLMAALQGASTSLDAFEQAMGVVQNNVSNASTPGYVTQTQNLNAGAFQPGQGLWGGVHAGAVESSRNQYAEQAVWNQNQLVGASTQQSSSLNALQQVFDISGTSGIPAALSSLYSAFSAWSTTPSDATAQQQVVNSAQQVTQAFNQAATSVNQLESQTDQQLQSTVSQINQLSSQIAQINQERQNGSQNDAGLDATLYNTLEQLSNLTSINVQPQGDGSVTVLMGGQTPLVVGSTSSQLQVTYLGIVGGANPSGPPTAHILTIPSGQDVTEVVNQGQLAALVQFRNTTLPSVIGDGNQQGSLNQLAQSVADRVNTLLTSGQSSAGPPPVAGVPLFTYQAGSATNVAQSLATTGIAGSQLAAIDPSSGVANGIADQLSQLANPQNPADMINGLSYTGFYGGIASDIGGQASTASTNQTAQSQALAQAQNMRAQVSGVSLNDQASKLLQFQQAYEAAAQMITVINQTLQSFFTAMQST